NAEARAPVCAAGRPLSIVASAEGQADRHGPLLGLPVVGRLRVHAERGLRLRGVGQEWLQEGRAHLGAIAGARPDQMLLARIPYVQAPRTSHLSYDPQGAAMRPSSGDAR